MLATNVEGLQHEVSQLRLAAANATVEHERKLEGLKVNYDNVRQNLMREQDNLHNVIIEAVRSIVLYKVRLSSNLGECDGGN